MEFEKYMSYDKTRHQWRLNENSLDLIPNAKFAYQKTDQIDFILSKQSSIVYAYIYGHIPFSNRKYIEYLLAKEKSVTEVLFNALLAFLESDLASAASGISAQMGANLQSGMIIQREDMRRIMLPESVKIILENGDGEHNLFYCGKRATLPTDCYERWEY